jgi:tripeptidyl-peptidase-1
MAGTSFFFFFFFFFFLLLLTIFLFFPGILGEIETFFFFFSFPRSHCLGTTHKPHRHGDSVTVHSTVRCVEHLFGTPLVRWQHERTGRVIVRAAPGATRELPDTIRSAAELVLGVWDYPAMNRVGSKRGGEAAAAASAAATSVSESVVTRSRHAGGSSSSAGSLTVSAPTFAVLRGLDQAYKVSFVPAAATSGAAPVKAAISITAPHAPAYETVMVSLDNACSGSPTVCVATVTSSVNSPVINYYPYKVSVMVAYADGSESAWANSHYPMVCSPPLLAETVRRMTRIPDGTVVTSAMSTSSVVEFEEQYYSPSDLQMYLADNGIATAQNVTVIGPNDGSKPGGEANLDIQWLLGIAPGSPLTFWSVAQNSTLQVDNILAWQNAFMELAPEKRPLVTSISYGMPAALVDHYFGAGYLARSDAEFAKIAAAGEYTVIIADGDTGSFDDVAPITAGCNGGVLRPDWPSQSPYILAIGSTFYTPFASPVCYSTEPSAPDCAREPVAEVAVSVDHGMRWTTGGGFANTQATPAYQAAAVAEYLARGEPVLPPAAHFNASGRGYPDALVVGHNLLCRIGGALDLIDGTSASAPLAAAMLVLINDARLTASPPLPPLGFVNPRLYSAPHIFRDITVGDNSCGSYGMEPVCCYESDPSARGFKAAPGWDAVSGLGSFADFELMKSVLGSD